MRNAVRTRRFGPFVFLGDYIHRGPDSPARSIRDRFATAHAQPGCLPCGNHEDLALIIDYAREIDQWVVFNGGDKALRSYGVTHPRRFLPVTSPGFAACDTS